MKILKKSWPIFAFSLIGYAQGAIHIQGNQRISSETIQSYLKFKSSEAAAPSPIQNSIQTLFETGYFEDIQIEKRGGDVFITVKENPTINRIVFEGEKTFKDAELEKLISDILWPRSPFQKSSVKQAIQKMRQVYATKGFFNVVISPKLIAQKYNRVDLVFEIQEGARARIKKIQFVGNAYYLDMDLILNMYTQESAWYRFFNAADIYTGPDQIRTDEYLLRRLYAQAGYLDAQIRGTAEVTPNHSGFIMTYSIDEGARYKWGKVEIDSQIPAIPRRLIEQAVKVRAKQWANMRFVEKSIQNINKVLGRWGYAFAEIVPRIERHAENGTADIRFEILPGSKHYVNKIVFEGNLKTNEDVLRYLLPFKEGDAFNQAKIEIAKKKLTEFPSIRTVSVNKKMASLSTTDTSLSQPSMTSDQVDIIFQIEEKPSTSRMELSGKYDGSLGIYGEIGFSESNLWGQGKGFVIKGLANATHIGGQLGYSDPYILGGLIGFGTEIFATLPRTFSGATGESSYMESEKGVGVRFWKDFSDEVRNTVGYSLVKSTVEKASSTDKEKALSIVEEGSVWISKIYNTFTYDQLSQYLLPTDGFYFAHRITFAGLGGDVHYLKNNFFANWYYSFGGGWVLKLEGKFGLFNSLEKNNGSRLVDRFTLGGDGNFDGFDLNGMGPYTKDSQQHLGGQKMYTVEAQMRFPIGLPKELGVLGIMGIKAGSIWDSGMQTDPKTGKANPGVVDEHKVRLIAEAGIYWMTPLGFALTVAFPAVIMADKNDKLDKKPFSFGLGASTTVDF